VATNSEGGGETSSPGSESGFGREHPSAECPLTALSGTATWEGSANKDFTKDMQTYCTGTRWRGSP